MTTGCSVRNLPIRSWWVGRETIFDFGVLSKRDEIHVKESLLNVNQRGKSGFIPMSITDYMLRDVGSIDGVIIDMDIVDAVKSLVPIYKEVESMLEMPGMNLTVFENDASEQEIDAAMSIGKSLRIGIEPHAEGRSTDQIK